MKFRPQLVLVVLLCFCGGALGALLLGGRPASVSQLTSGEAAIGGPFTLTRQDGARVTDANFRGRYMLVTFGYTFCPDICPAELQTMAAALKRMGDGEQRVQPVFVTIDPERDTVSQLASYVGNFGPNFVGLTGSAADIAGVAKAYRVYYRRADDASAAGYLMDHTALTYLISPEGKYLAHFAYGITPDVMAARIAEIVQQRG